jgi:hypothetical protein
MRLKACLLIIFLILHIPVGVFSQEFANETAISYGFWSNDYLGTVLRKQAFRESDLRGINTDSLDEYWQIQSRNLSLTWYFINIRGTLAGISFTGEKQSGYLRERTENTCIGSYERIPLTIALELKVPYRLVCMHQNYMSLGLGYTFGNEKFSYSDREKEKECTSISKIAFMIRPFNISMGGKISFFLELGCSYKGAVSAGIVLGR